MSHTPDHDRRPTLVPTWAVVLLPMAAVVISNADVVFLAITSRRNRIEWIDPSLVVSIPLSLVACAATIWFMLRLRREVDQRARAEHSVRVGLEELAQALDRERLLRRELDHRVRNNLASLLGLLDLYEAADSAPSDVVRSMRGRILSLREAYALIASTHGDGIELSDLLRAVTAVILQPPAQELVRIDGPSVRLTSREANAFALVMQELLTNSLKHGALMQETGSVQVSWSTRTVGAEAHVEMEWSEQPVRPRPPEDATLGRTGLGLSLIEGFASTDLRGGVRFGRERDRWIVKLQANLKVPAARTGHTEQPVIGVGT